MFMARMETESHTKTETGFTTAPLASSHRGAGGGAVEKSHTKRARWQVWNANQWQVCRANRWQIWNAELWLIYDAIMWLF